MEFEYTRYEVSGELTVILITVWWMQKLGKNYQYISKQHRSFMLLDLISGN